MSGPFTNSLQQLVEQANWLKTDKGLTWDNLRFDFYQAHPGTAGELHVGFSPPFPREVLGFSANLDFSGGLRPWIIGFKNVTTIGFTAVAELAGGFGGYVDPSQIVGIFYLAWGR